MKKLILTLIVLGVVGGGVAAYYLTKDGPEPTVTTLQITRGDIVDSVGATGTLEAVETVDIGTQVSGTVSELYADFNSIVKKGQVIARLDPSLIETQIEQQRANVTRAEADLERLRVTLADTEQKLSRAKELSARSLIPKTELETAEINVQSAQAQIRSSIAALTQARSQLNTQEVNLGHTVIRAPIDGIIISRNVDQGQTVAASMNAPVLYSLAADLTKMQVIANIDEAEIGKMRPGQPVNFRVDAYPSDTFHGSVHQVRLQPTTVQNVVTYSTVISVPNEELKLKPGMTANVTIEISRKNNVLRAPNAALRFRPTTDIFAAFKQEVPPELQRGFGRGGQGGQAGPAGSRAGFSGASGQQGAQGSTPAQTSSTPPSGARSGQQAAQTPAPAPGRSPQSGQQARRGGGAQQPAAQGGGDRGGDRPSGDTAQRDGAPRDGAQGEGRRGNMTPEEREARRKQFEERMKSMSPEERAEWEARMRERGRGRGSAGSPQGTDGQSGQTAENRGGRGGGAGTGAAGTQNRPNSQSASRQGSPNAPAPQSGSRLANTTATTIDALFAPIPIVEGRGRVWLFINKQLKSVPVRTGITDGTWTEILETPETAPLQVGTEIVTNVTTGLESQQRTGQQGSGSNPLMPQRGQPGRGGPGGAGPGRGR
jgi:HlyD family secretion protein